jgi:hypothetical protein
MQERAFPQIMVSRWQRQSGKSTAVVTERSMMVCRPENKRSTGFVSMKKTENAAIPLSDIDCSGATRVEHPEELLLPKKHRARAGRSALIHFRLSLTRGCFRALWSLS